jgi:murein DD-endopeptidase MepM/ murein hydrolase activator NlpD
LFLKINKQVMILRLKIKRAYGQTLVLILACCIFVIGLYLMPVNNLTVNDNQPISTPVVDSVRQAEPSADTAAIKMHQVQSGDTLSTIADKYNIDVETVIGANPRVSELIHPGEELVILPRKGVLHEVRSGDTLWDIANIYDVTISDIMSANLKADAALAVGERIFVPGARPLRTEGMTVSRNGSGRFIWPTRGELSSPFGYRWGRLHAGIDLANDFGTPIKAAGNGRVAFTGWQGGYGYTVIIEHGQGYTTLYGHLAGYNVASGDYVRSGTIIGYMGSTGFSTGPHLHFEVRHYDQPFNPYQVLP